MLKYNIVETVNVGLRLLRKARNIKSQILKSDRRDFLFELLPKNSICAEIGVYKGDFSQRILDKTNPKKLILIDAWDKSVMIDNSHVCNILQEDMEIIYKNVQRRFAKKNVEIKRKKSIQALREYANNIFDWIYIDGSHEYNDVLDDLEMSLIKVKKGGLIVGDDYANAKGKWENDVIRAVSFFTAKHNLPLKIIGDQYVIRT